MKQLIKLTPKGKFFFGGDRVFSSARQSYYAKSEYFPQQTALLGMLRYSILKRENALQVNDDAKRSLIGNDFPIEENSSFGKLKNISPVFILENNETIWLPKGKDYQLYEDNFTHLKLEEVKQDGAYPNLTGYDPKTDFSLRFVSFDKLHENIETSQGLDYFFCSHSQVGNEKAIDGKTMDNAFYKNDLLSFKRCKETYQNRFSFAFWVETDNYSLEKLDTINLGSDSKFKIEVVSSHENIFDTINASNEVNKLTNSMKLVLTSNAYIENVSELRSYSDFILAGEPIPFKFIKSAKDSKHYNIVGRKSEQYYLLERGTVIYPKNITKVLELLDNPSFQKIGYNNYRILKR